MSLILISSFLIGLIIASFISSLLQHQNLKLFSHHNMQNNNIFLQVKDDSDFSFQNIPFGVFSLKNDPSVSRCATRIGDWIIDLRQIQTKGYFKGQLFSQLKYNNIFPFQQSTLNLFMSLQRKYWIEARQTIQTIFLVEASLSFQNLKLQKIIYKDDEVVMLLPVRIGDYTDFYSSYNHAKNMGIMIRGENNAIQPNWFHLPIGYHERSSSSVVSGHSVVHPRGQVKNQKGDASKFQQQNRIDFQLEVGYFIGGKTNQIGSPIRVNNAWDNIFGLVLLNDWSFRDLQMWEYVPLGPFTSKNGITTISPWVITLQALRSKQITLEKQNPAPLKYLSQQVRKSFDIQLTAQIITEKGSKAQICETNLKYLYWTFAQQLAHHTVSGCKLNPGDLIGTGTISGPKKGSFGSLIQISEGGKRPIQVEEQQRIFLQNGDSITLRGHTFVNGKRVGFGECTGTVIPALAQSEYY